MAYVKKISDKQFALDIINKEFEIAGTGLHFETYEDLQTFCEEHKQWYSDYSFATPEQFYEWKDYFYKHFYDWQPKRCGKTEIDREFGWFNLQYGLKYDFSFEILKK